MATYLELYALRSDANLTQKLSTAILVACNTVRLESNQTPFHKNRVAWAQQAIHNPEMFANKALGLLLAQNKDLTVAQINAVSDSNLQTAVNDLVNTLTGLN
jgi:hypothetical protein